MPLAGGAGRGRRRCWLCAGGVKTASRKLFWGKFALLTPENYTTSAKLLLWLNYRHVLPPTATAMKVIKFYKNSPLKVVARVFIALKKLHHSLSLTVGGCFCFNCSPTRSGLAGSWLVVKLTLLVSSNWYFKSQHLERGDLMNDKKVAFHPEFRVPLRQQLSSDNSISTQPSLALSPSLAPTCWSRVVVMFINEANVEH